MSNSIETDSYMRAGTILAGKYEIVRPLSVSDGEATLYICTYDGEDFIAKVYNSQRIIKPEVISILKSIYSPLLASFIDTGEYSNLFFEILPYYKNGSLQGKMFSYDKLRKYIIPCINEALHMLHQHDIIHKNLKPSNIMLMDDSKGVAIIDFGISTMFEDGNTMLSMKISKTPEYSTPETFQNLFYQESDYYSFGMILYELYCGFTPYKYMNINRIPFPSEMPQELQDLISGLTYTDITNENDKVNPTGRWTYEEVSSWCKGIPQELHTVDAKDSVQKENFTYTFLENEYYDIPSLMIALADNWSEGKKHLYRGLLSAFFKTNNPEIASYCMDAEEAVTHSKDKSDLIFWSFLYRSCPKLNGLYWMGKTYESIPAFGLNMLKRLWNDDKSNFTYWDSILSNRVLSAYLEKIKSNDTNLITAILALETAHNPSRIGRRDLMINYYTLAYLLSGQIVFNSGDKQFRSVVDLTTHIKGLLDSSYKEFEIFCHKLFEKDNTLDAQFEAWLIALGKRRELEDWKNQIVQ